MVIKEEFGNCAFAELSHIDLRQCEFFDLSGSAVVQLKLLYKFSS